MELTKGKWSENLKLIRPEVKNLFYKGDIDLLFGEAPKLAIVGSRRMTEYGERVIKKWMPDLVSRGVVIVSGFMYGVDQAAHKACIENGGKTIAVLGYGIEKKVGNEDEKLYKKILEVNSLILSEYPGEKPANKGTFPERNRIVAGISDAILVIEAAERSGSLITARLASEFKKPLMAIPGRIDVSVAKGTNILIKNEKAKMVTEVNDVLGVMKLVTNKDKVSKSNEEPILFVLKNGSKSLDELSRLLRIGIPELNQRLMILTLQGELYERNGKYHRN